MPLRTPFRGVTSRSGVLFRGPHGLGEFSPFADYSDQRSALWLQAAIEAAYIPVSVPDGASVPVNAIIGDAEDPRVATHRAVHEFGCTTVKVKLGADLESDLKKLEAITSELRSSPDPQSARIRVDINGRWNLDQAVTSLTEMREFPIEYVEQPCPDRESLIALRRRIDIPIAVDESIRVDRYESVRELADIAILKVSPLGGLQATRRIAEQLNMPVRISSALETSVGLFPSLVAAWELAPEHAAGLATGALFAEDLVSEPLVPREGRIAISRMSPSPDRLGEYEGTSEQIAQWRTRTEYAFQHLPPATIALLGAEV